MFIIYNMSGAWGILYDKKVVTGWLTPDWRLYKASSQTRWVLISALLQGDTTGGSEACRQRTINSSGGSLTCLSSLSCNYNTGLSFMFSPNSSFNRSLTFQSLITKARSSMCWSLWALKDWWYQVQHVVISLSDAFYRKCRTNIEKRWTSLNNSDIWDTAVSTDFLRLQIVWLYWQSLSSRGRLEDRKWSCCCRDSMVWWPAVRIYGQIIKGHVEGSWKRNKMCTHEHLDAVTEVWQWTFPRDVLLLFCIRAASVLHNCTSHQHVTQLVAQVITLSPVACWAMMQQNAKK